MSTTNGPSLADDENQLVAYGEQLVEHVDRLAYEWLLSLVERRAPGLGNTPGVQDRLRSGATEVVDELRTTLQLDLDDQRSNPLQILRRAVRFPGAVLAEAETPPVPRDDFAMRAFPDDVFDLTPASFADIDPSLHEPGLIWGAAKAHVHLRRRRDQS